MIKFLIMDVDGTLTDGRIYIGNSGEEMKAFSVKDGCGVHDIAIPAGIKPVVITGRRSKIVEIRCLEMGITEIYQGISNKIDKVRTITSDLNTVAYMGDDINDLPAMNCVRNAGGKVGCPIDAVDAVKEMADFVSKKMGGDGAVREFIEWIISANNRD